MAGGGLNIGVQLDSILFKFRQFEYSVQKLFSDYVGIRRLTIGTKLTTFFANCGGKATSCFIIVVFCLKNPLYVEKTHSTLTVWIVLSNPSEVLFHNATSAEVSLSHVTCCVWSRDQLPGPFWRGLNSAGILKRL